MANRLINETSPYLLQHAHNPVDWYAWGPEVLERAAAEDKLILLSIGYSACHWCHVMEHESFENPSIAKVMNEHFVNIKGDREERPDLDQIYMSAVQIMTGSGGWPLTIFLLPNGEPIFGGTYFPPEDRYNRPGFLRVLETIAEAYRTRRAEIMENAKSLREHLTRPTFRKSQDEIIDTNLLDMAYRAIASRFDSREGGFGGAPKFPPSMSIDFLLRYYDRTDSDQALHMATLTLDKMAYGGMYDQVGGGFHRYSTDDRWLVPHFEKMLYDQASLASAYTEAWLATKEKEFSLVARETLDYVLRDMTHPEGGFYSAEDADSEGVEGKFYLWTDDELKRLLAHDEYASVAAAYGVTARGNYEHSATILNLQPGQSRSNRPEVLDLAMKKLLAARARRVRPHLDDKVLTSWNGLMISAMARAYQAFGEPRYLQAAQKAAHFVLNRLRAPDGRLLRRWREGEARFPGYVDDYAFFIDGLIELYQSAFDRKWIDCA